MIIKFLFLQLYHLTGGETHKLEYDPKTQYVFHRNAAVVWLIAMAILPLFKSLWLTIPGLIIEEISLYANFSTEFGSMSSALAARKEQ